MIFPPSSFARRTIMITLGWQYRRGKKTNPLEMIIPSIYSSHIIVIHYYYYKALVGFPLPATTTTASFSSFPLNKIDRMTGRYLKGVVNLVCISYTKTLTGFPRISSLQIVSNMSKFYCQNMLRCFLKISALWRHI